MMVMPMSMTDAERGTKVLLKVVVMGWSLPRLPMMINPASFAGSP
jgi:hypothetical protein